jgi:amino acid adenylation domain-containing protein
MKNKIKLSPYHLILYYEQQLAPKRYDYNLAFTQKIKGILDTDKLSAAIKRLVAENFIYHCTISEENDEYFWKETHLQPKLELFDSYDKITLEEHIQQPFRLKDTPACRFALFKTGNQEYTFSVIFHHIIIDGGKFNKIISSISEYYNNINFIESTSIREQIHFLNDTQKNTTSNINTTYDEYCNFWKNHTQDLQSVLKIDKIKNSKTHSIKTYDFSLKNKVYETWKKSLKSKSSSFNTLITAFAILISRYTNEKHISILYPISIDKREILGLGSTVNTIFGCFYINEVQSFNKLIEERTINFTSEIKNSMLPIYDIIKHTNIKESLISFAQTNLKNDNFNFKNCKTEVIKDKYLYDIAGNDLSFEYELDKENNINFRIKYKNIYSNEFITTLAKNYLNILNQCLTSPNKPLHKIKTCNIEEFQKIIYNWNKTEASYPANKTIHELFVDQVKKTPENIALSFNKTQLTYKELDIKSNILAECIRKKYREQTGNKLGPDTLIPICVDKSINMLIGILGILKAGAAYVPIDPNSPKTRKRFILDDTNAKLMLTNSKTLKEFATEFSINLDDINFSKNHNNSERKLTTSNSLAYIIYTSGTSGTPKGVMIEHRQIINTLFNLIESLNLKKCKNCSLYSNYIFDASVYEMFPPLLVGSTLQIVPEDALIDQKKLIDFFNKNNVEKTFLPTAMFKQIYKSLDKTHLKFVHTGGESLTKIEGTPNIALFNQYGPTEASVYCTELKVTDINNISIGKPIRNIKTYILDKDLNLVPVGITGELHIAGAGVARGYLNKPDLTSEKFIKNPFATKEDLQNGYSKLYKTGDICRWQPNGNIEFIGRNDNQVKIRGFRIELGEIESILTTYPKIKQHVVTVYDQPETDNKILITYYLLKQRSDNKQYSKKEINDIESNLRNFLSETLPDYMVPTQFINLKKIPLNSSGKIDIKALPIPDFKNQNHAYIPPETDIEKQLVNIWQDVLKINKIGIEDNFFKLGGNSIISIKLINQINNFFEQNLSVMTIFKYPNIKKLAEQINIKKVNSEESEGFSYEL